MHINKYMHVALISILRHVFTELKLELLRIV